MKGYGIPAVRKGMLEWKRVSQQLRQSRNYWIATTTPDGLPHAVPVWGVWVDGALYFGTDRRSRKARNLATNQGAVVHLEGRDDAVILEGFAEEITPLNALGAHPQALRLDSLTLARRGRRRYYRAIVRIF